MAIKPFNSIEGFSVGEEPANIILANGDITTTNITANGISNLGPVSNLILTGGSSGQVVTTDGSGNLTFTTITTNSNLAAPMPYFIPTGESYTVSDNFQGLFSEPIEIDGVFEVIGTLIELGEPNDSANTQILFNNAGVTTGNTGFTFNKTNGNVNIAGNVNAGNVVTANYLIGDGGLLSNITAVSNLAVTQIQNGSSVISFAGTNGNATIEIGGVANILVASTGGITTNGLVVSGVSNLGDVANLKITGGSFGYTLTTDGTGNLSWDAGSGGPESIISNGTSNINIGTVDGAATVSIGGISNIAVFSLSGLDLSGNVTASRLISNVTTGVAPLVVASTTQVANLNSATAGTVRTNAQPNITSVGTLTDLSVAGNISVTGNISASNITGNITSAGTVTNAAQPNITSVGTLSNLSVSGNVSSFNVSAANNVSGLSLSGSLTTGVQSNITQVGTLSVLAVTANITAGNINAGNLLGANYIAGTLITATQPNITQIGTLANLTVNGNANIGLVNSGPINANGTVTGVKFESNVATGTPPLTVISTSKVSNLYVEGADSAITVTASSQPNITTVGSLTNLSVSGNAFISGDLYVDGNITYLNVSSMAVEDPLISVGNGPNNAPLTTNDGKDRGLLLNYYSTNAATAFMGWDNGNAEFSFAERVSVTNEVITYVNLGNIRAGNAIFSNNVTANYFVGNLYGTANLATYATTANAVAGANVSGVVPQANFANTAGYVTNNTQSNITSVGTLTQLSVTGNVSAGNINGGNLLVANYVSGSLLTPNQTNVTSLGNLINLTVSNAAGIVNFTNTQSVELGSVSNLSITGPRTEGYVLAALGNLGAVQWVPQSGGGGSGTAIANGTSNVNIATSGGNVTASVGGNANVLVVTGTGINVAGTINSTGNITGATGIFSNGLSVTGNITATGNLNYQSVTDLVVGDPLIYIGANNTGNLVDLGIVGSYNDGTYEHTGLARDASDGIWKLFDGVVAEPTTIVDFANGTYAPLLTGPFTSNSTITANGNIIGANISTAGILSVSGNANIGNLGTARVLASANVTSPQFISNISTGTAPFVVTSTTQVANLSVATAGTVTTAAQPNITSVGTLTSLGVNGVITGVNITANTGVFTGNGSGLSSIAGANVTGTVSSATTAGTVTTAAQPNITSLGTLTSLSVSGNVTANNITASGILYSNNNIIVGSTGSEGGQIVMGWVGVNGMTGQANGTWNMDVDGSNNFRLFTQNATGVVSGITMTAYSGNNNTSFAGNVSAPYFIGNGSQLTGIVASAGASITNGTSNVVVDSSGNVRTSVAGTANVLIVSSNTVTAPIFAATENGNGTNFKVGDDAWIGDINTADTIGIKGQQNAANAYIVFGNSDSTGKLGRAGTGPLTYAGAFTASGNVTGANVTATAHLINGVTTGITAAGTQQSNATALTTSINIVTTTNSGTGVVLPTAVGGMIISVINAGGNTLAVYPATNGVINSQSANVAYSLGAGGRLQFVAGNTTQWYTLSATYA